jgi:thymidylate synthase (FAD)
MKIIKPSFEILTLINSEQILTSLELAGRICYKSEKQITFKTAKKFVTKLILMGHESVLEHQSISVRIICDRGISHELVRHRIASYSQESTRYCNYSKTGELTFIEPCFFELFSSSYNLWYDMMNQAEQSYNLLIKNGCTPQEARSILPNSLKTEIIMTMNLREWRHFFKLRALGLSGKPHPQMLEITIPLLKKFQELIPVIFDDLVAIVIENLMQNKKN